MKYKSIFLALVMSMTLTPVYAWGATESVVPVPTNSSVQTSQSGGQDQEQEYQLLSGIPGLEAVPTDGDFSELINAIYKMAIGLGSALAVLFIVFTGFKYAASSIASEKGDMKDRLTMIVGGLVLLLSAYMLLEFINPRLTQFDDKSANALTPDYSELQGYSAPLVAQSGDDSLQGGSGDDFLGIDEGFEYRADNTYSIDVPDPIQYPVVYVLRSKGTRGTMYRSLAECRQYLVSPDSCEEIANPALAVAQVADTDNGTFVTMTRGDGKLNSKIPYSPTRTFKDFASKGNGSLKIARSVIMHDAYIQAMFYSRYKKGLRLVSAYRDPAHNSRQGSTANNHQLGYSLDYGTKELSQEQLVFLQELIQATGAVRVGWGSKNNAGTHVQWDDGHNTPYVYWCYSGTPGPFKGPGSMPGFKKGTSCQY